MKEHNNYRCSSIGASSIISIVLILSLSGCIGVETRSNISVVSPEVIEVIGGKVETISIEIIPYEADAKNVIVNLSAPPEISVGPPQSKEFKLLSKDQKVVIPFNYSAVSDGTFNFTMEIKAINANTTSHILKIYIYVPSPNLEIGEFWIYNQTKGMALGLHAKELLRIDTLKGNNYYVIKETWEGEPNGTYALSYYSTNTYTLRMIEYYEDNMLFKEKTMEFDPPRSNYGFPIIVGKKWNWSGSITGIGRSDMNGEIVKKEKVTVPSGTYTGYHIRQKMSLPLGTIIEEGWYVPELNEFIKIRMSKNIAGTTFEDEIELLEHGKFPDKPSQIQPVIKMPEGWGYWGYKLYKNEELNFRVAYPGNWGVNLKEDKDVSYFYFDAGTYTAYVSVESIGKLNLSEFREIRLSLLKTALPNVKISEEKNLTLNGRKSYQWVFEYVPTGEKGTQVIFIADGKGYIVGEYSLKIYYDENKPVFDSIVNSFFIKGNPRYS